MITIQGKGVSAGVSIGPLYFYRRASTEVEHRTVADTRAEWQRFLDAQAAAMEQLGALAEKARSEAGDEAALLFEVHQMMAEDLLRFSQRTLDSYPHQQCHRTTQPGDPPPYQGGRLLPRRQLCPHAGLCQAPPRGRYPVGVQEIHEHETPRGRSGERFYR